MKNLVFIVLILGLVSCDISLLDATYPYPSSQVINILLNKNFHARATITSVGEVMVPFNLNQFYSYVTAPDCVNCEIYGIDNEQIYQCNQQNFCSTYANFEGLTVDQNFKANGQLIRIGLEFDQTTKVFVPNILYTKRISQLIQNSKYHFFGIGLAMDRAQQSSLISSLYQQGKIEYQSYSLYFDLDQDKYHLTIGGYNQKLISQEFYNLKSADITRYMPYRIINDLVLADISMSQKSIAQNARVLIDPTVEGIILPQNLYYQFQEALKAKKQLPDVYDLSPQNPGAWSSLKTAPSFTISFLLDDPDALSRAISLELSPKQFMHYDAARGIFTPQVQFVEIYDQNDDYLNVVRVGKVLFENMMYYKQVTEDSLGNIDADQRLLSPLVKASQQ